jgi:hypothetical protein
MLTGEGNPRIEGQRQPRSIAMQGRDIQASEKECISQCILKFWSDSDPQAESHDERYEQCLTDCDVCGSN